MEAKGIDGAALALRTGLTPTAISYYKNGKRMPGATELFTMAKALEVTMNYLMGEDVESGKFNAAAEWRSKAISAQQKLDALKSAVQELMKRY